MPGYPTHLLIQRMIPTTGGTNTVLSEISRKMKDHPQEAAMGSIGPDLTFFLDLTPLAQVAIRGKVVYDAVRDFARDSNNLLLDVTRVMENALPDLGPLRRTYEDLGDGLKLAFGTFHTTLARWVSALDFFSFVKLPMANGMREEDWFWFDMLHYRRTSQFASSLYDHAHGDPRLQAFAAGYVTHLAADVTGHAFVNACTGGPYRTLWQRHHCCDNYIDVWAVAHYQNGLDVNQSHWDQHYPREMDAAIREQFSGALHATYASIRHPDGRRLDNREWPNDEDIRKMYDSFWQMIQWQTNGASVKKPEPPDCPVDLDKFPKFESFEETSSGERRRERSWWDWFKSFLKFVKDTAVFIHKVVKWALDTVVETALWPARYAAYQIHSAIYAVYRSCRRLLALRGYCYAHPDELVAPPNIDAGAMGTLAGALLVNADSLNYDVEKTYFVNAHRLEVGFPHPERLFITADMVNNANQQAAASDPDVAAQIRACLAAGGFPLSSVMPWVYPTNAAEVEATKNGPYENGSRPDAFIERAGFNSDYYAAFKGVGDDVQKMLQFSEQASRSQQSCLGNAVDLGRAMLTDVIRDGSAPDFNLDGDRGYGWLCWDVKPIGNPKQNVGRRKDDFPVDQVVIGSKVGATY